MGQFEAVAPDDVDVVVRAVDSVETGGVDNDVEVERLPVLELETGRCNFGDRVVRNVN